MVDASREGTPEGGSPRRHVVTIWVLSSLFAVLAALVLADISWVTSTDHAVATGVTEAHSGPLNTTMRLITLLGNRWIIGSLLLLVAAWVLRSGRCRMPVAVMIGAFLVNPVLEALLKGLVGRSRPEIAQLVNGAGPAFPSGHVLATVGFYGVLAVFIWRSTSRRSVAVASLTGAAVVIALVGFSRIYLGVHWLTDVVGGFLVGSVFVLAVAMLSRNHRLAPRSACTHPRRELQRRARVPSSWVR